MGVAVLTTAVTILSSDEAAKHIESVVLFYAKAACTIVAQGFLSLKLLQYKNGDGSK